MKRLLLVMMCFVALMAVGAVTTYADQNAAQETVEKVNCQGCPKVETCACQKGETCACVGECRCKEPKGHDCANCALKESCKCTDGEKCICQQKCACAKH